MNIFVSKAITDYNNTLKVAVPVKSKRPEEVQDGP